MSMTISKQKKEERKSEISERKSNDICDKNHHCEMSSFWNKAEKIHHDLTVRPLTVQEISGPWLSQIFFSVALRVASKFKGQVHDG